MISTGEKDDPDFNQPASKDGVDASPVPTLEQPMSVKSAEQMEAEIPMILKNDMVIQFHEERLIDLEERKNGNH